MKIITLLLAFSCAAFGQDNLFRAVSSEDPKQVRTAFQRLTDFWATDSAGLTVLRHAVHIGNTEVVQALLDAMRQRFGTSI